jgi:hypothetical protein
MRERALGVQEELTSVVNEVVILDGQRGRIHDGSWPKAAGRLVVVAGDDIDGSASTIFRLAERTSARQ